MIDILIGSALVSAVPLTLAALGGLIHQRAGVVNIGLEGQMLLGALVAAVISGWAHSWLLGSAAAFLAGGVAGLLMSFVITRLKANEIIVGLASNILIAGLIGYILRSVMGVSGTLQVAGLQRLPNLDIPGIGNIPVIGAIVSGQTPLFWLAVILVPITSWLLRHTRAGLRLRAVGAAEAASRSLGLATMRVRDTAGTIAGALAGLGGAALSIGAVGLFNENMIAGRGFVALAAFYFGRSRPLPTAMACLLFGFFDALQIQLQGESGVPTNLIQTLPYVVVIIVLTITAIRRPSGHAQSTT